jgi:hypothetical protein
MGGSKCEERTLSEEETPQIFGNLLDTGVEATLKDPLIGWREPCMMPGADNPKRRGT